MRYPHNFPGKEQSFTEKVLNIQFEQKMQNIIDPGRTDIMSEHIILKGSIPERFKFCEPDKKRYRLCL
jgi:hypothetical protein